MRLANSLNKNWQVSTEILPYVVSMLCYVLSPHLSFMPDYLCALINVVLKQTVFALFSRLDVDGLQG